MLTPRFLPRLSAPGCRAHATASTLWGVRDLGERDALCAATIRYQPHKSNAATWRSFISYFSFGRGSSVAMHSAGILGAEQLPGWVVKIFVAVADVDAIVKKAPRSMATRGPTLPRFVPPPKSFPCFREAFDRPHVAFRWQGTTGYREALRGTNP
jgi:hypothetical protein